MIAPRRFLPSIASLRALEALDRLGSASSAAEELSLTQSAVSRQLQTLERQLGTELIVREKKRMLLTPEARKYAAELRQALGQIAQASLQVQTSSLAGQLSLGILPTFGMRWLVPRLADFAKRHPDITINMSTRLVPFNFAGQNLDAAIHFGDSDWPGTHKLKLKTEQVIPVCAPELLPAGSLENAADVLDLPLLHIETRPRAWANWLDVYDDPTDKPMSGTMYDQFSTITQAALHGLGVALLPDYLVESDLAAGRLMMAHEGPSRSLGAYYLVWPFQKDRDPSLQHFREWLEGQAEDEDPLPR
ncbi:MAG: LysR substrate-binding domain-containing protein [Paracoccaceae bacterium]